MSKPPTSVRSIRLPDELWAKLSKRAAETGTSVNALVAIAADLAVTVVVSRSEVEAATTYDFRRLVQPAAVFTPHPKPGKAKR